MSLGCTPQFFLYLQGLGGVRLQTNCCAFSIGRNCGCVWGREGSRGKLSLCWRHAVTSLPAGARSAGLLCRDALGRGGRWVWQRQPENKQGRARGLFSSRPSLFALSIKRRALLIPPRFDMALRSVTGCLAQGMYLWSLVMQAAAEVKSENVCDVHKASSFRTRLPLQVFAPLFMRISATIENNSSLVGPLSRRGTPAQ